MSTNCISGNIPQIWRLSGVTRTIRCTINDAEGEPRDLSDLTLAVVVSRDNTDFRFSPSFVVEGEGNNIVKFGWPADKQGVGDYTIEVTGVDGSGNVDRVNWHGATGIRLVDYTNEVRGDCPAIMSDEPEIGLEGEYTMNGTGMSAYEEWLADGHEGTPHDFILWLQEPATSAAAAAEAQMVLIQGRADEDHTRAGNDHTRAESDHGTASSDHTRAEEDHTQAGNDHTLAASDHTRAGQDHDTAASDHTRAGQDHDTAAEDHRVAGIDHGTAADDHTRAGQDHQTASDDHTQAGSDHTRAGEDHTRAGDDHQTASSDHTRAGEDHTQAGNDHTRAEADHGIAADDHTQAAQDHQQAVSDHETWADKADTDGYYERMGVGTAKNLEGVVSQSAEFIFRKTGGSASVDSGLATMSSIKGKSLVWNQLVQNGNFANTDGWNFNRATGSASNNELTVSANDSPAAATNFSTNVAIINGHKYLIRFYFEGLSTNKLRVSAGGSYYITTTLDYTATTKSWVSNIFLASSSQTNITFYPNADGLATASAQLCKVKNVILIDLTLMFGAGNEPSTVAEFEAMYPLPYYAYNAGEIVSNSATAIETVGFNQWDEEWGNYGWSGGTRTNDSERIGSAAKIYVLPSTTYCIRGARICIYEFDAGGAFLRAYNNGSFIGQNGNSYVEFTTDNDTYFITFATATTYGTTYNHDICINFSDSAKNGTYQPYEKHTLNLNLPTLTGKLNGEGTSVTICSDGLKSAGTVYDYGVVENGYLTKIVKRIGVVDMGSLTWRKGDGPRIVSTSLQGVSKVYGNNTIPNAICEKYLVANTSTNFDNSQGVFSLSGIAPSLIIADSSYTDAATFKTAMSGVKLIYELATPETYILDNPVYVGYLEDGGGTERRLPEDTSSSVIAPFSADIVYPINAVGALQKLPENFISKESMQAFLASLGTQMGGTWTMTWNATTGKYTFTFTPNA